MGLHLSAERSVLYYIMLRLCLHFAIVRFVASSVLLIASTAVVQGCSTERPGTPIVDKEEALLPPVPREMRVVSSFGGVHRKIEIVGGVWFQSFANRLLALDAPSGTVLVDLELAPLGTTGPLCDFVILNNHIYAVLEDDEVVEIDMSVVRTPVVINRWKTAQLGIKPRTVSLVNGEVIITGDGGVVRLAEAPLDVHAVDEKGEPIPLVLPEIQLAGRMVGCVLANDDGAIACVGRRIVRVKDGSYLGAASKLIAVDADHGGGYAFLLQAGEIAEVGLMGSDFRERSSSALHGQVHSIRIIDDRFLAVNDFEVATWKLERTAGADTTVATTPEESAKATANGIASSNAVAAPLDFVLGALISVPVKGARDVGRVQRNRFAVSGSFGRALYRYLPEGDKPGDEFYWSERLPGRLDVSVTDRRRIQAASIEGSWMYLIGERAELTDRPIASPDRSAYAVELAWGSAKTDEIREEVTFAIDDRSQTYRPSRGGKISTMVVADGRVWIGHDHGVDVLSFNRLSGLMVTDSEIRLGGPMIALYPNRVGGGIAYVAAYSGFGVIRPIKETEPPTVTPGCVTGEPPKPIELPKAKAGARHE